MLERERHRLILRIVEERAIVSVGDLSALIDASEATLRRDIAALADRGALKRIRGGAEALDAHRRTHLAGVPFALNLGVAAAEKRAIARAAAALLGSDESLIISGGTTTLRLAAFLTDADCDVLTNSFPVAAELLQTSRCRVALPGGTIYREQNIVLSPFETDAIDHFAATTLLTGAYAVGRAGLMETDPLVAQATRRLLGRAERLMVLADSRKLRARSSIVVAPLARIDVLVTDEGAKEEELLPIREAGVEIVIAEVLPEDRA